MSCPDWKALVAAREAAMQDPPAWRGSLEHLVGCDACRRQALAADPTLVFQRLPRRRTDAAEIEAMRGAVATLVRSRRLGTPAATPPVDRRLSGGRWLRPAAAAALLAGVLTLGPAGSAPERTAPAAAVPAAAGTELVAVQPAAAAAPAHALVEDLDLPQARIYQVAQDDLSVVMIVDASLDL